MSPERRPAREVTKHVTVIVVFLIAAPLSLLMAYDLSPVLFLLVAALVLFVGVRIVLAMVRSLR